VTLGYGMTDQTLKVAETSSSSVHHTNPQMRCAAVLVLVGQVVVEVIEGHGPLSLCHPL
jgi:hypothetical protein